MPAAGTAAAVLVAGVAAAVTAARPASSAVDLRGLETFRHTAFAQRLANDLAVPGVARTSTGAVAFDLHSGRVVYALNPKLPLVPASNEKLTVTYAALSVLGPAFRYRTVLLGSGSRRGRVWHGSLYLRGSGDPTLRVAGIRRLVAALRARGIRRVSGNVFGDESAFDRRRTGPGWKPSFYLEESPPLSALVVARSTLDRRTSPYPAAAAATILERRLEHAGVRVDGRALRGRAPRPPDRWPRPGRSRSRGSSGSWTRRATTSRPRCC